jgi:uncharacterized protein (TIGR02001 family)
MSSRQRRVSVSALHLILSGALLALVGTPASAQVAGDLTLQSDYRLRGRSLSAGEPALTLNLSYDHPTGVYLNGSTTGVLRDGDPAVLGLTGNVGYARRLTPEVSFDSGIMWSEYRDRFGAGGAADYTEVYLGLYARRLSAHVYYSPDYYYPGVRTLYSEVEGAVEVPEKVRLSAHLGFLNYVAIPRGYPRPDNEYDWRLAAARQFGALDLRAALTGGGPGPDYYDHKAQDRTALVVSASWTF